MCAPRNVHPMLTAFESVNSIHIHAIMRVSGPLLVARPARITAELISDYRRMFSPSVRDSSSPRSISLRRAIDVSIDRPITPLAIGQAQFLLTAFAVYWMHVDSLL